MSERSASAETPQRPIVVLLVDDQAFVAAAIRGLLAAEPDIVVHHCQRAPDAMAMASHIGPDVVLQDLLMPDIDGLTLVHEFRSNPLTAGTPVIVLSGNDDAVARAGALTAGATDYLVKLPTRERLVTCIRHHASQGNAKAPAASVPARTPATAAPDGEQTLDSGVFAIFHEADPSGELARTLIDQFLRDGAVQVASLAEAAHRADIGALEAIVHSLKGSASTMGATRLAALCRQTENHLARRTTGRVMTTLMAEMGREFLQVREALLVERQRVQ